MHTVVLQARIGRQADAISACNEPVQETGPATRRPSRGLPFTAFPQHWCHQEPFGFVCLAGQAEKQLPARRLEFLRTSRRFWNQSTPLESRLRTRLERVGPARVIRAQ
jgi:hypothetical protein